jgi:hypothetical protein
MTDAPKNIEEIARHCWGAAQRIGMQIAEMTREKREEGFAIAERALWDAAKQMGMPADKIEGLIKIQMQAIRGMVSSLDVSGSPQGGNA